MVSTQVLRLMMDASVNGTLLFKSYNEAYEILERIANNNHRWAGVHNVDALTVLSAQVTSLSNIVKTIVECKKMHIYKGENHHFTFQVLLTTLTFMYLTFL